jgi:hypothetical protein
LAGVRVRRPICWTCCVPCSTVHVLSARAAKMHRSRPVKNKVGEGCAPNLRPWTDAGIVLIGVPVLPCYADRPRKCSRLDKGLSGLKLGLIPGFRFAIEPDDEPWAAPKLNVVPVHHPFRFPTKQPRFVDCSQRTKRGSHCGRRLIYRMDRRE